MRALTAFVLAVTAAGSARASGYFSGVNGARASGRGGAFTARADDLSAVALNPAGLAGLPTTLVQIGNRFGYNAHSFTRAPTLDWGRPAGGVPPYVEFAPVSNREPWQLLEPLLGVATNFGLRGWGFALSTYAPAGIGRQDFPVDGGQRYMIVSRDAVILHHTASAAFRFGDSFALGASLQWVHVPSLTYELVIDGNQFPGDANPVASELDMLANIDGSDPFTFNAILGAWFRPAPFVELGISGQIVPTRIETDSTLTVTPLSPEIDEPVELSRDGEPANDVRLILPLPVSARAGARYRHLQGGRELFDVELNVGYESWSRVERFSIDSDGLTASLLAQTLEVGRIEIDKQWQDTLSLHLGGDYNLSPERITVRAGLFHERAVADRSHANLDFVSGPQFGGALGASVFVQGVEIALGYVYRHQPVRRVSEREARVFQEVPGSQCRAPFTDPDACHPAYPGRPSPAVNAGEYRAHSHSASLDALCRF